MRAEKGAGEEGAELSPPASHSPQEPGSRLFPGPQFPAKAWALARGEDGSRDTGGWVGSGQREEGQPGLLGFRVSLLRPVSPFQLVCSL